MEKITEYVREDQKSEFKEFLKLFFENLRKVEKKNRTLAKCLEGIEAIRLSADGLTDEEERMYKRAIKIGVLSGEIKK